MNEYKCNVCTNIECRSKTTLIVPPTKCTHNFLIVKPKWKKVDAIILTTEQEQAIKTVLKKVNAPKEAIDTFIIEVIKETIKIKLCHDIKDNH